ncbi:MAG: Uma2 family endonuclease [Fimbriimonadales bacterium]|nr:Uma2 family endonuclease [Fimbriimonadales bacterium]
MTSATRTQHKLTAEEFARLCADGKPRELVRGEVVDTMPVGTWHAITASFIDFKLRQFLSSLDRKLGVVMVELGVVIRYGDTESVRAPDVAFIRYERLPNPLPQGYAEFVPDLAIEVVSPHDAYMEVQDKVHELLSAGVEVVWVIDPQNRKVEVHQKGASVQVLSAGDTLTCETILPGFSLPVSEIFAELG